MLAMIMISKQIYRIDDEFLKAKGDIYFPILEATSDQEVGNMKASALRQLAQVIPDYIVDLYALKNMCLSDPKITERVHIMLSYGLPTS